MLLGLGCLTVRRGTVIRQPSQQQSWRQGGVWLAHRAIIKHVTYAYMYRVQHENLHAQGQSPDTPNSDVPFVALHLQQSNSLPLVIRTCVHFMFLFFAQCRLILTRRTVSRNSGLSNSNYTSSKCTQAQSEDFARRLPCKNHDAPSHLFWGVFIKLICTSIICFLLLFYFAKHLVSVCLPYGVHTGRGVCIIKQHCWTRGRTCTLYVGIR